MVRKAFLWYQHDTTRSFFLFLCSPVLVSISVEYTIVYKSARKLYCPPKVHALPSMFGSLFGHKYINIIFPYWSYCQLHNCSALCFLLSLFGKWYSIIWLLFLSFSSWYFYWIIHVTYYCKTADLNTNMILFYIKRLQLNYCWTFQIEIQVMSLNLRIKNFLYPAAAFLWWYLVWSHIFRSTSVTDGEFKRQKCNTSNQKYVNLQRSAVFFRVLSAYVVYP